MYTVRARAGGGGGVLAVGWSTGTPLFRRSRGECGVSSYGGVFIVVPCPFPGQREAMLLLCTAFSFCVMSATAGRPILREAGVEAALPKTLQNVRLAPLCWVEHPRHNPFGDRRHPMAGVRLQCQCWAHPLVRGVARILESLAPCASTWCLTHASWATQPSWMTASLTVTPQHPKL